MMSWPATMMVPEVGTSSRSSNRMNVDLPEPECPTMKTNSPCAISQSTSHSAAGLSGT